MPKKYNYAGDMLCLAHIHLQEGDVNSALKLAAVALNHPDMTELSEALQLYNEGANVVPKQVMSSELPLSLKRQIKELAEEMSMDYFDDMDEMESEYDEEDLDDDDFTLDEEESFDMSDDLESGNYFDDEMESEMEMEDDDEMEMEDDDEMDMEDEMESEMDMEDDDELEMDEEDVFSIDEDNIDDTESSLVNKMNRYGKMNLSSRKKQQAALLNRVSLYGDKESKRAAKKLAGSL